MGGQQQVTALDREVGAALRQARTRNGWSLGAVEARSEGRWKAVVVGSYERGDRRPTVARLVELARFYGVPAAQLLPDDGVGASDHQAAELLDGLADELHARAVERRRAAAAAVLTDAAGVS